MVDEEVTPYCTVKIRCPLCLWNISITRCHAHQVSGLIGSRSVERECGTVPEKGFCKVGVKMFLHSCSGNVILGMRNLAPCHIPCDIGHACVCALLDLKMQCAWIKGNNACTYIDAPVLTWTGSRLHCCSLTAPM